MLYTYELINENTIVSTDAHTKDTYTWRRADETLTIQLNEDAPVVYPARNAEGVSKTWQWLLEQID